MQDSLQAALSQVRSEVKEQMAGKADVQDVSRAVSEVIQHTAFDHRPELEELRRQIA